ncbi:MAG TPA: sigma 54-interacting transcriptional regulator [Gemmataceae bacterium]|nr:sigma 54-interacting transcriptional regulator [Gemmataceae bacterium]
MTGEARTPEASGVPRPANVSGTSPPETAEFRWQALFQRAREPVFVLNRRRRILFVNRSWETLTGISAAEARGLACVRRGPLPQDPWDVVVRSLCCPPPEVLKGETGKSRRLVPGTSARARWWDVEFLPFHDDQGLLCIVGKITVVPQGQPAAAAPLPEKLMALREGRRQRYSLAQLASNVPAHQRIADQVRLAGQARVAVLILGEPGTGKATVARTIHEHGSSPGKFMALDCRRLPAPALAALLVGKEEIGSGTLSGGTCYLKEPQRLPRDVQARLCDALKGSAESAQPRIIAGMSAPPADEVKAGRLVEELHAVLGTLVIALPALRERQADLGYLVEQFLKRAYEDHPVKGLTEKAWDIMRGYAWPGNLRELFAVLQFGCLKTDQDLIDAEHLPAPLRLSVRLAETAGAEAAKALPLDRLLEEAERRLIRLALRRAKGNRSRAAELLEIWRPRLLRRMEALGITEP